MSTTNPSEFDDEQLFDVQFPNRAFGAPSTPVEGEVPADLDAAEPHVSGCASTHALDADAQRDLAASHERLGDALPAEGWLAEFVRMAIPMTSAPTEFHLAAGLNALASALGNRSKIENWGTNIYPNLWTLVVAPSSNWHKTTSMGIAQRLLDRSGLDVSLADEFGRESFLKEVAERPAGLVTIDEFATLLQLGRREFGQGILSDLTRIFDGKDYWKRALMTRVFEIRRPALSIYAATTIDYLQELVTPADLRAGFFYRFLFVTAAQKNANRKNTQRPDSVVQNRLIAGLHRLSKVAPAIRAGEENAEAVLVERTPEARQMWEDWLDVLDAEMDSGKHAPVLNGFFQRIQTYALKLAMVYRASASAFEPSANALVVDGPSMRSAIAYCNLVLANTLHLFENDWADSKEARELQKVEEAIGGGCSRTDALRRTHMQKFTFDRNLDTLIQSERIAVVSRTNKELGREAQRERAVEWLQPGANHSTTLAKRKVVKPIPTMSPEQIEMETRRFAARLEEQAEWEAATEAEEPIPSVAKAA